MTTTEIMDKIDTMINANYVVIGILIVILIAFGFALYYFAKSLIATLTNYRTYNKELKGEVKGVGNSLKDTSADNEIYIEPSSPDDAEIETTSKPQVDPKKFMPRSRKEFIAELEKQNMEYNEQKTNYLVHQLNYPENDDVVDERILYKEYDNYKY